MDLKPTKSDREWLADQIMALPTSLPVKKTKPGLSVDVDEYRRVMAAICSALQASAVSPVFARAKARLQRELAKMPEDFSEAKRFEFRKRALATYDAALAAPAKRVAT